MDPRLVPINAVVALTRGDGGWPRPLGEEGFHLHLLEAPVASAEGPAIADALLWRESPAQIALTEAKSGGNVDPAQAKKYASATSQTLRRAGSAPRSIVDGTPVGVLYVCLHEHRERISRALADLKIRAALLSVAPSRATLTEGTAIAATDFDVETPLAPPGLFPIDSQSPPDLILEVVAPVVVAAMTRPGDVVDVRALCSQAVREWGSLGRRAQRQVEGAVIVAIRTLQGQALKGNIELETGGGHDPRVRIIKTPRDFLPQGRTQGYQRLARRVVDASGRGRPSRVHPDQQPLFDELADMGGLGEAERG